MTWRNVVGPCSVDVGSIYGGGGGAVVVGCGGGFDVFGAGWQEGSFFNVPGWKLGQPQVLLFFNTRCRG